MLLSLVKEGTLFLLCQLSCAVVLFIWFVMSHLQPFFCSKVLVENVVLFAGTLS